MKAPDGKVAHAEIRIGDSPLMMSDEWPGSSTRSPETVKGLSHSLWLYVDDCDAWIDRAVKAGAKSTMAAEDMFWGDRVGSLVDPFGYSWEIATHQEEVSPEEIKKRGDKFFGEMTKKR